MYTINIYSLLTGDMSPKYRDLLVEGLMAGARNPDGHVRASSISNLGEVCKQLRYSLGGIVFQVFTPMFSSC